MTAEERKQYAREWMLERAAILEYEGGHSRQEAERFSIQEWYRLRVADPDLREAA